MLHSKGSISRRALWVVAKAKHISCSSAAHDDIQLRPSSLLVTHRVCRHTEQREACRPIRWYAIGIREGVALVVAIAKILITHCTQAIASKSQAHVKHQESCRTAQSMSMTTGAYLQDAATHHTICARCCAQCTWCSPESGAPSSSQAAQHDCPAPPHVLGAAALRPGRPAGAWAATGTGAAGLPASSATSSIQSSMPTASTAQLTGPLFALRNWGFLAVRHWKACRQIHVMFASINFDPAPMSQRLQVACMGGCAQKRLGVLFLQFHLSLRLQLKW